MYHIKYLVPGAPGEYTDIFHSVAGVYVDSHDSLGEVREEEIRFVSLALAMLNWFVLEERVELHRLVRRSTVLILSATTTTTTTTTTSP